MKNTYLNFLTLSTLFIPSSSDWDLKINDLVEEYKQTKFLPRKDKKRKRKKIHENYSFYQSMKKWSNPFDI